MAHFIASNDIPSYATRILSMVNAWRFSMRMSHVTVLSTVTIVNRLSTFRPIASNQLNSLTTLISLSMRMSHVTVLSTVTIVNSLSTFRLNSLTTLISLSKLGGADVTHPLWVRAVPCSIPCSVRRFDV